MVATEIALRWARFACWPVSVVLILKVFWMPTHIPENRWPSPIACRRIEREFDLPYDVYDQDWEIVLADPDKTEAFLAAYEKSEGEDDYRFALMAITIASADFALAKESLSPTTLDQICSLLRDDANHLGSLVHYWACLDAESSEECFAISPAIRAVWEAVFEDRRSQA